MISTEDVVLRGFRPPDLKAVKDLIDITIRVSYSAYPTEFMDYWMETHSDKQVLEDASKGFVVVLEHQGRIIGTGTFVDEGIKRVFVHRSYQGKGFGTLIMHALEEHAVTTGARSLTLTSTLASKPFYDSLGYATLRQVVFATVNGMKLGYCLMNRKLGILLNRGRRSLKTSVRLAKCLYGCQDRWCHS